MCANTAGIQELFLLSAAYCIKAKFIVMHCSETAMLKRIDFGKCNNFTFNHSSKIKFQKPIH